MWILRPKEHVSLSIAKIGFLIYLGASLYRGFSELMIQMVQMKETDNLIKIAYNDALTGVGNRYKFDKDVKDKNIEDLCLVSIDLNNLKYYNDSLGHIYGDRLIKKATEILKIVYGNNVYRTGGDEFIVIQNIKSEEERQKDRERLADLSERYTAENDKFIIEIACGDSVYRNGDITYEDILKRADKKMYEHKAEIKSKSPIKFTR